MLGIRTAWREEGDLSPAEAVFGSQPLLPGQFLDSREPPTLQFLQDFRNMLANRWPTPTSHHSKPAPEALPEDLLLARHVLVRRDGATPPLTPIYDGPYLVLERSLRFFKLQIGNKTDNVSILRLKACKSPPDMAVAQPPRRGRPPAAAPPQKPKNTTRPAAVTASPSLVRRQPSLTLQRRLCRRQPHPPSLSSTCGGPVGDDTLRYMEYIYRKLAGIKLPLSIPYRASCISRCKYR
jgi:hypothetical protein